MAVHYGMWVESTGNFRESLINTNCVLMDIAQVKKGERILDAGCGVGGSAIFLAKEKQAKVSGVTLSEKQYRYGKKHIEEAGLENLVDINIGDYTETPFNNNTFDLIWALESLTSAPDKKKFAREAARILKPNGRIIIADYFATGKNRPDPHNLLEKWRGLWSMAKFLDLDTYIDIFNNEGYKLIRREDVTDAIRPSSKHMYNASLLGSVPSIMYNLVFSPSRFARTHYLSGRYQYKALKKGLWKYYVLVFEKK